MALAGRDSGLEHQWTGFSVSMFMSQPRRRVMPRGRGAGRADTGLGDDLDLVLEVVGAANLELGAVDAAVGVLTVGLVDLSAEEERGPHT